MSNVVVLGGGFGGAACAVEAAGQLGPEHTVTVVDRQRVMYLCGANPFLIVGARRPEGMSRTLDDLAAHGVRYLEADVTGINLAERIVTTNAGHEPYDYLVIALGATYDWDAVPGSREAYAFYDHGSALRLRDALASFDGGAIAIGVAGAPIKCPPAPFETAMVLAWEMQRRGIGADIHVTIPEPAPMGVAGPEASKRLKSALEARGVTLHAGAAVTAVDGPELVLSDGESIRTDLAVTVPIHRVPEVVAASGLTGGKPWVPVDAGTLETSYPNVFAIGDVNAIPVGEKAAVPKAGAFAAAEGRTVARHIVSRVTGDAPAQPFDGVGHCFIAFSGEESALVGGDFFAPGGPRVELEQPSPVRLADKEQFEARWRSFTI